MELEDIRIVDGDKIYISIPLEEYKDLLIIKGKYEELKSQTNTIVWPTKPNITYTGTPWHPKEDEKGITVTCEK